MTELNDSPEGLAKRLADLEEKVKTLEEWFDVLATKDDIRGVRGLVQSGYMNMMELHGLYAELQVSMRDSANEKETSRILDKIRNKRTSILKGLENDRTGTATPSEKD